MSSGGRGRSPGGKRGAGRVKTKNLVRIGLHTHTHTHDLLSTKARQTSKPLLFSNLFPLLSFAKAVRCAHLLRAFVGSYLAPVKWRRCCYPIYVKHVTADQKENSYDLKCPLFSSWILFDIPYFSKIDTVEGNYGCCNYATKIYMHISK